MKLLIKFSAIIYIALFFSCSNDTSTSSENNQIKDDFSYLTVNASGKIEKIGNNSGKISSYSQIEGLKQSNFINLNTITSNSEKIFAINHIPPSDILYIFDRITKTTSSKVLTFPKEIIGYELGTTSLVWDESKKTLFGIVTNNVYGASNYLCYLVKIDPNTFEISYQGVSFKQKASYTTILNNDKLYSSYAGDDTFEIDLNNNNSKPVLFNNSKISFQKATIYNNNTAYCLRNGNSPYDVLTKINLNDYSYEDIVTNESFSTANGFGKGFIDKSSNEYVAFITKNGDYYLLKYNILTKNYKTVKPTSDSSIDINMQIIDKVNN